MKLLKLTTIGAIASLSLSTLGFASTSASALTLEATGTVSDAVHDGNSIYPSSHAFWFPELGGAGQGKDFVFQGGAGTYNEYSDGNNSYFNILGSVVSKSDATKQWDVDIWFKDSVYASDNRTDTGKDKLELKSGNYVDNGGTIDPETWRHWDIIGFGDGCTGNLCSSITGDGAFEGLDISLTQRPGNGEYTFQSGEGANGKNLNNGISGWFEWTLDGTDDALDSYHETYGQSGYYAKDGRVRTRNYNDSGRKTDRNGNAFDWVYHDDKVWHDASRRGKIKFAAMKGVGDINIDLESSPVSPPPPPVSVPEPTALLGLAAVGFAWRKRKKNAQIEDIAIS